MRLQAMMRGDADAGARVAATPSPGARSVGSSCAGATPPSNGAANHAAGRRAGVTGRVLSTASSLDAKVDRALDRVDGIVGRVVGARGGASNKAGSFTPLSTEGD